jgi:hypothetical protein
VQPVSNDDNGGNLTGSDHWYGCGLCPSVEMITGHPFTPNLTNGTVLERIRTRLPPLLSTRSLDPKPDTQWSVAANPVPVDHSVPRDRILVLSMTRPLREFLELSRANLANRVAG